MCVPLPWLLIIGDYYRYIFRPLGTIRDLKSQDQAVYAHFSWV